MPVEVVWIDESYLTNNTNFQVNKTLYEDTADLAKYLKETNDIKMVTWLGGGMMRNSSDTFYKEAVKNDLLLRSAINQGANGNAPLVQRVKG